MNASAVLDLPALEAWGRLLGAEAFPGLVVGLVGPLGAGKTTLVRAIVDGAGGDPTAVASPTFVLVQEYMGRFPIAHLDVYRLKSAQEYLDLGVDEMTPESLLLVEWADKVRDQLPPDRLEIVLTTVDETTRKVEWSALGKVAELTTVCEALDFDAV
jgi:tRNA threonylcarbamoyladenosine biosynthesis protein TsaE